MPSNRHRIPRPPNAFIFYRSHTSEKIRLMHKGKTLQSKLVSMIAGHAWNMESQETKMAYHSMADAAKEEHRLLYPDYQFEPKKAKDTAARAKRTRARDRNATKDAKKARKGRKATSIYRAASPTPSLSPSTSSLSLSTSSSSQPQSLAPTPPLTPPLTTPVASYGYGQPQGPQKQPWINTALAALNELPPHERAEAMQRIRLLNAVTSTMPLPQPVQYHHPMVQGQGANFFRPAPNAMIPNHHYQVSGGVMASRAVPSAMLARGALHPMSVQRPLMNTLGPSAAQQVGRSHPTNANFGQNMFARSAPQHPPGHFPHTMGHASASGASSSSAVPWQWGAGHPNDHVIDVSNSPMNAPVHIPNPLDVSSSSSIVHAVGKYEPQSPRVSDAQAPADDSALPELSSAGVIDLLESALVQPESSPASANSSLDSSSADVPMQDPFQVLDPGHIWPQELDEWFSADCAEM